MSERYTNDGRRKSSMAHAKHARYCSCGRIVHGNGFAHHRAMHERAGDGHRRVTQTQFAELFPGYQELPWPERGARKIDGPRPAPTIGTEREGR